MAKRIPVPGKLDGYTGQMYYAFNNRGKLTVVNSNVTNRILKQYRLELTNSEIKRHGLRGLPFEEVI